jgi:hypothetical protein
MSFPFDRRSFLKSSAALGGTLLAGSVPLNRSAKAVSVRIDAPIVDRVVVQEITDGAHDIFLKAAELPGLSVQRTGIPPGAQGRTLQGCDANAYMNHHFTGDELAGKPQPDQHWHEHATCFRLGDRGLVVISSCGHAGIINTLRRAQEVTGVEKIYALVGGFHLAPAPDDYLRQVMAELKKFDIEHVLPMHCSGQNFIDLAKQEMP